MVKKISGSIDWIEIYLILISDYIDWIEIYLILISDYIGWIETEINKKDGTNSSWENIACT